MSRTILQHLRTTDLEEIGVDYTPKLPTADQIAYGEIAINYADGYETFSIKNSNDEIVTFGNEVEVGSTTPLSGSNIEIFIDESIDPLEVEVYTKSEIDTKTEALETVDTTLQENIDEKVMKRADSVDTTSAILVDEDESPTYEVYTKEQVDAIIAKLKEDNNLI